MQINPQPLKPLCNNFNLRRVQKIGRRNLIKSYRAGHRKVVLWASPASGKTLLAADLIRESLVKNPYQRIVFTVPRLSLLDQTVEVFKEHIHNHIQVIQGRRDVDFSAQVYVATAQTIGKRYEDEKGIWASIVFNTIYIDEVHLVFKKSQRIPASMVIGLTGTPYSPGLGKTYTDLVKTIPALELVKEGIITPMRVLSAVRKIDTSNLRVTGTGEYNAGDEELEANQIIGDVYKEWKDNPDMKGRKFLGFAKNISTCVALAEEFQKNDVNVAYVHSKMTAEDCDSVLNTFKAGLLDGVFSVAKLAEGFSYPVASAILLCTAFAESKKYPGYPNSRNRYAQILGRGRRQDPNNPGKVTLIHDHGGSYLKYGNPDHFETGFDKLDDGERRPPEPREQTQPKARECSFCHCIIERGKICPTCGHESESYSDLVDGEVIDYIDGEMVVVEDNQVDKVKRKAWTYTEKQEIYSGLLHEYSNINARLRAKDKPGIKVGWIAYKYKEVVGVWPRGMSQTPAPSQKVKNYLIHLRIKDDHDRKNARV